MEGGWGNTAKVKLGTMFFFFSFVESLRTKVLGGGQGAGKLRWQ